MSNLREHRKPVLDVPEIVKSAGYVAGAGVAATVGGVVVLGSAGCRCGGDRFEYEAWAETDGAAGRINMQGVQEALEQASDPSDFEDRINQLYEGEHPVLIRVYNSGQNQFVEGWEDLNDDGNVTEGVDDKIFTVTRGPGNQTTVQGHGANSYYTHAYPMGYNPMGGFFMGFLMANMMRPGWGGYATSPMRRTAIVNNTRAYRSSSAFATTQARNRGFFASQRATNPGFAAAARNHSPARQSFRGRVQSSGGAFRGSVGRTGTARAGGTSGFRGGGR